MPPPGTRWCECWWRCDAPVRTSGATLHRVPDDQRRRSSAHSRKAAAYGRSKIKLERGRRRGCAGGARRLAVTGGALRDRRSHKVVEVEHQQDAAGRAGGAARVVGAAMCRAIASPAGRWRCPAAPEVARHGGSATARRRPSRCPRAVAAARQPRQDARSTPAGAARSISARRTRSARSIGPSALAERRSRRAAAAPPSRRRPPLCFGGLCSGAATARRAVVGGRLALVLGPGGSRGRGRPGRRGRRRELLQAAQGR